MSNDAETSTFTAASPEESSPENSAISEKTNPGATKRRDSCIPRSPPVWADAGKSTRAATSRNENPPGGGILANSGKIAPGPTQETRLFSRQAHRLDDGLSGRSIRGDVTLLVTPNPRSGDATRRGSTRRTRERLRNGRSKETLDDP